MENDSGRLLDPEFLRKLELLRIRARHSFPGVTRGERRSTRQGSSVEFSDFRKYETGDDFRHVDWNIYARLDRLMLRQFLEEEDVRIDILLDASGSMQFGKPVSKFYYARRAAAALAFLAVESHDRVGVATFDSRIGPRVRALRGQAHLRSVVTFLESLSESPPAGAGSQIHGSGQSSPSGGFDAGSATDLESVLRSFRRINSRTGILFIISDFLDAGEFRRQLKLAAHAGFDVNLIQVLSPEEREPVLAGDLLLIDSETGEQCEVTTDSATMKAYRVALDRLTRGL
ncbi:MAG TPA: DUF58 domain-containing protein, partial [Blastocatellia bacterium]|nr:DUF58 domain-containing protein [Blastocatellia bacterium]